MLCNRKAIVTKCQIELELLNRSYHNASGGEKSDPGTGLATVSSSQIAVLHDKPWPWRRRPRNTWCRDLEVKVKETGCKCCCILLHAMQLSFFSDRIRGVKQWQTSNFNLSRVATQWHEWELNPQPSSYKAVLFPLSHCDSQGPLERLIQNRNALCNHVALGGWGVDCMIFDLYLNEYS